VVAARPCCAAWVTFLVFTSRRNAVRDAEALRDMWAEQAKSSQEEVERLRLKLSQGAPVDEDAARHSSDLRREKAGLERHNAALADAAHALQKERDEWKNLYLRTLSEAGATQGLLYDALQRCRATLAKHGVEIPPENGLDRLTAAASGVQVNTTATPSGTQAK